MHATNTFPMLLQHLVQDNIISTSILQKASREIPKRVSSATEYLVSNNVLTAQFLFDYCLKKFNTVTYNDTIHHPNKFKKELRPELVLRFRTIPLLREQNTLHLGMSDPTDQHALTSAAFDSGLRIKCILMNEDDIESILNQYYKPSIDQQVQNTLAKLSPISEPSPINDENIYTDEPVISFVDKLIKEAIDKHVSDIHIEPYEHHCRVRFRCDGLLYEATTLPPYLASRVITRLKIMAKLNIAEKRLPQDGHLQHSYQHFDIRINLCPTIYGEKVVLRILHQKKLDLQLETLGLLPDQLLILKKILSYPHGLILVTGPTGSGKTITLYSALHYLNQKEKNICTIEDPVEIELPGINQINVNTKIGLDSFHILHSLLRQDPDIIMLGEIREENVAKTAVQAAQTGHLVLTTLHAGSSLEAIRRLTMLGVSLQELADSIELIISQRLVRKLCTHCHQGCNQCHAGYQGRTAIFELLPLTHTVKQHILSQQTSDVFHHAMQIKLKDAGIAKMQAGIINETELNRVCGKIE